MAKSAPKRPGDIIDEKTRLVRVFSEKCTTCIFRPGNPMYLERRQLGEIISGNIRNGALLTCHQTLPYGDSVCPPTACSGFWDGYGLQTIAGLMAAFSIGIMWVKPPTKEEHERIQAEAAGSHRPEQEEDQAGAPPAE